jgi:hypothetical protein
MQAPAARPLTTLATSAGTVEIPVATPAGPGGGWRKVVLAGSAVVALVFVLGGTLARRRSPLVPGDASPGARALRPATSPAAPAAIPVERTPLDPATAPAVPAVTAPRELDGAQPAPRNAEPPPSPRTRKAAGKSRGGRGGSGSVTGGRQAWSPVNPSAPPTTGPAGVAPGPPPAVIPASAVPASPPREAPSAPAAPAPNAPRASGKVKKW